MEADSLERLRYAAACKLSTWHEHQAGGGSFYIAIGDSLKLRYANHENNSAQHRTPDFNFINRYPTQKEVVEIAARIQDPRLCKKTAYAMHCGLTVPKLKKVLTPECLEDVCENEAYPNTYTEHVLVAEAFGVLEVAGIRERIPVRQELFTLEDYAGY